MYKAKIITINSIEKHPNADRLQIIQYNGMQFVVDLSFNVGDVVILFPTDGQLSHDFCHHNNLYRDASKNKDNTQTGFFEDNRRVRAQPFRKVNSEGFVTKLSALNYLGKVNGLEPGYEFDTINGKLVCEKYITEGTRKAIASRTGGKSQKTDTRVYYMPKHYDTPQLAYEIDRVKSPCLIIVTEKMHGTSGRTGRVLTTRFYDKPLAWLVRGMARILRQDWSAEGSEMKYEYVSGTRNTIINERPEVTNPLGAEYFRWEVHNKIAPLLNMGETVYYEIVGFDTYSNPIMQYQNTANLEDINKKFGNIMIYSYGCTPRGTPGYEDVPERDMYVYRITQQGHGGDVVELSWFQMVKRCKELRLKTVPVLAMGYGTDDGHAEPEAFARTFIESCRFTFLVNGPSTVDNGHLMEGICVRVESESGITVMKDKNYAFKVLEGILKESSSYVDKEEIS